MLDSNLSWHWFSSVVLDDSCVSLGGPCKASKPQLEQLAKEYATKMPMGIVYESDLGDDIHNYSIRAFPTYVLFVSGKESKRVEGVNLAAVQEMMDAVAGASQWESTQGAALGGGSAAALSPEQARLQRLAKLGGGSATAPPAVEDSKPSGETTSMETEDDNNKDEKEGQPKHEADGDVEMKEEEAPKDPTANLNPEDLKTLTESMGFSLLRAQKGLLFGNGGTLEGAVDWIMQHQNDDDIDEPIPADAKGGVMQSYKCNECGKILSNMANLELHANKTGHSDFEESTQAVKPLTPEEKAAKIAEIKELLKAKRAEREEAEKVDNTEREKQRRFMGKEMAKTREEMEIEQRKREAQQRKREKEAFKRERARLRAELAKDKAERQANKGKLSTKLGIDGYNPDGVQYDVEDPDAPEQTKQTKKPKVDAGKIDEYIKKVSSYRAGGDGGKCLKILKIYVGNAADNPDEAKYKSINMDNKAFKTKVKPFIGGKQLLMAVGFQQPEGDPTTLVLNEPADYDLLKSTKEKLEAALVAYGWGILHPTNPGVMYSLSHTDIHSFMAK